MNNSPQSSRHSPPIGRTFHCFTETARCAELSRCAFLGRAGAAAALGALAWFEVWPAHAVPSGVVAGTPLPSGKALKVNPVLVYHLD